MKKINNYILEKLKINKESNLNKNLREISDKIAFMCGWPAGEEDDNNPNNIKFTGKYTETHLDPKKDASNAYILVIDNWVHINNVTDFDACADHFALESTESNNIVVNMFRNAPKLVKETMDRMTATQQLYSKHKVHINSLYEDKSIYMFTDENTLIFAEVLDDDKGMVERVFIKKD